MGRVIGIDLGTTNSCVAFFDGRRPVVIPNKGGYTTTPSVVAVLEDGRRLVGQVAKRQAITNPANTIFSVKRLIGRRLDSREAKISAVICPYEMTEGPHGDIRIRCSGREFSLPEISAFVLSEMKRTAEEFLTESVQDAIITVPAYFNDGQRQATKDAGKIAGLNILRIINEPTAAAIAYGFNKAERKTIAVFDLGGGTFDVSILEIEAGVFKVLATRGDTFLGGDDIDNLLIDHVAEEFSRETGVDLRGSKMSMQRLKDACEKAKCDLSGHSQVEINLPFIHTAERDPVHLLSIVTRRTLEHLTKPLIQRSFEICSACMNDAGIERGDLDDVLLVGGQTRMPAVADMVSNFFGRSASRQINPDEAVAVGAAIQGHILSHREETEMLLLDVTPFSLGIRSAGGSFTRLIDANTTVPVSHNRIFTTVADNQSVVRIQVFQGEHPVAEENEMLGEFLMEGIPKAPAGEPEIDVVFNIDANGIVQVAARDVETGQEQSITVTMSSGLTHEEIDRMKEAAKVYDVAVKDQEQSEALVQRAEVLHHRVSKLYRQEGAVTSLDLRDRIEKLVSGAPSVIAQRDPGRLALLVSHLESVLKEIK